MIYEINNEYLTVKAESRGGELQSVKDAQGTEYLWQGDPAYWPDRALNIFPYVARLTMGKYHLYGKEYHMNIHGFVCTSQLYPEEITEQKMVFRLQADDSTRKQYPFDFVYRIIYELKDNCLDVTYSVENHDGKIMYFGLGGHPGFQVPLEKNAVFEDYYLEFSKKCEPLRIEFSEDCFVTDEKSQFQLEDGQKIHLNHNLFDKDAIVLEHMDHTITLKSNQCKKSVTVSSPDMPYLGIWHMPKTDAPYVCIEPWTSLPSRKDVVEDFSLQPDLIALKPGHTYLNSWKIVIHG